MIDTGIDDTLPDLAPVIYTNIAELNGDAGDDDDGNGYIDDIHGYDFAGVDDVDETDPGDGVPFDTDPGGHGTHVAGIAAAMGNNGVGVAGVAWGVRLMALKVQADQNVGTFDGLSVIDALNYARENGARIVNCSYGGAGPSPEEEAAMGALRVTEDAGVLVVCASGNGGADQDALLQASRIYPAAYDMDHIISVGASDSNDNVIGLSNFGATTVDLMAPGYLIRSTIPAAAHTSASVAALSEPPSQYAAIGLLYAGFTDEAGITADAIDCVGGAPDDFPAGVAGNIALIQRGTLTFAEKVTNAAAAGAIGVIIYNNVVDDLDTNGGTLGSAGDWLPAVTITQTAGEVLLAALPVQATLVHAVTAESVNYGDKSGTSMAAPQVSGAAALLWSLKPGLTAAQVKAAILDSVDPIADILHPTVTGGRLNVRNALCLADAVAGDVNCDAGVDLADLVTALQVMAAHDGDLCAACFAAGTDPDGDGRLGVADAINILQRVAEIR